MLRCRRCGDDLDEAFRAVRRRVQLIELALADGASRPDVAGRQDAAGHGHEVGQEVDRVERTGGDPAQLLLDLGDVPVAADAVRLDALVDLAELEVRPRLAAGP